MKIAAVVPALDEEKNISGVLKVLLDSKDLDEVIVVDDGSADKTAEISRLSGARVISLPKKGGSGKANAMKQGIKNTDADVISFFDADLVGLTKEHISSIVRPIMAGKADMVVGVRGRWGGLPKMIAKIFPLLAIGGERAVKRHILENLPEEFMHGYSVEIGLNFYCRRKNIPVVYADLKGLTMVVKEKKWGLWKGFAGRVKMTMQIIKALVSTINKKINE